MDETSDCALEIPSGTCSPPALSRATALPKLVGLRSFGFYRLELDRTELPRVPDTPCSPDPALPKAVPSDTGGGG